MEKLESSDFLFHSHCPSCGSSDGNGVYSDGHTHCFVCGHHTGATGSSPTTPNQKRGPHLSSLIQDGQILPLDKRGIAQDTCRKFGYTCSTHGGSPVQVAPYYDLNGDLVGQKVRKPGKDFYTLGDVTKTALPFGSHAWPKGGRMLVLTEGEIDAMSVAQMWGLKYPVWSISCGADKPFNDLGERMPMNGIRKYISRNKEHLSAFDKVVICFDSDEAGRESARAAAAVIGPKAVIADLAPFKDANEMLVAEQGDALIKAIYNAQPYKPEGIVEMHSLKAAVKEAPQYGPSWPWEGLTELTYGIQQPYIYCIGAATGAGKTDVLSQIACHLVREHKLPIGMFMLEEEPRTTALGLASKWAGKRLHTPVGWDEEAFDEAWDGLNAAAPVFLYDSFGSNEWGGVKEKIEYLFHTYGVRHFFVDHLTAFAAAEDDERKALEKIMESMSSLVTKYSLTIFLVSHLATPEGKPHEEGGRVMVRNFKGSRAIGFWSHGMLGLERNQQVEDISERHTTTVRILKLRKFGDNVGKQVRLKYDTVTGILNETAPLDDLGFGEEEPTGDGGSF